MRAGDILRCLTQARPSLLKLRNLGKPYDPLIDTLVSIGEDDRLPSSKDLQKKFSVSPANIKKWIDTLYNDFIQSLRSDPDFLECQGVLCDIYVKGYRGSVSFLCRLPVIPRIGEQVKFPFLGCLTGSSFLYVSDVIYCIVDSELSVEIWVRAGQHNRHFQYLKDKAEYEGWLRNHQHQFLHDSELEGG